MGAAELGVQVAGVVLIRQRPGKGNAVFITIEDESGIVNALLWARGGQAQNFAARKFYCFLSMNYLLRHVEKPPFCAS